MARTEIRCFTDPSALDALAPRWNRLLARCETPTPFLSFEWIRTWWRHFGAPGGGRAGGGGGRRRELRLLAALEDGSPAAIAPLALERRRILGIPARILGIAGTGAVAGRGMGLADRAGFLVPEGRPDLLDSLLEHLRRRSDDWDLLDLKAIPAGGSLDIALGSARARPSGWGRLRRFPHDRSPYVPCDGTWRDYLASRTRSFRKSLRKRRNRLGRLPGFRIERLAGEPLLEHLPGVFELNLQSWKGGAGSALFAPRAIRDFFTDLARALAPREGLLLYLLHLEGGPIAYEICFREGNALVAWDAAYDPAHARWSPGTMLSGYILEGAFSDNLSRYDQSRGDHPYKRHWSRCVREEVELVAVRPSLRPLAAYLGGIRLRRLARRIPPVAALHARLGSWRNGS